VKARTFIITACATFALVVSAAQAASTKNALHGTRLHAVAHSKSQSRQAKSQSRQAKTQSRQAESPVPQPAAPGTGVPIEATTSDDYDNQQVLYGPLPDIAPAVIDPSVDVPQSPPLLDGYLLIDQIS